MDKSIALELAREHVSHEIVVHRISDDAHEAMGRGRFPYYPEVYAVYESLLECGTVCEMRQLLRRKRAELDRSSSEIKEREPRPLKRSKEDSERFHIIVGVMMAMVGIESFVDDLMTLTNED